MQWLLLLIIYGLAQLFEWGVGRGKHGGFANELSRVGLDFCRMGVAMLAGFSATVIVRLNYYPKFNKTLNDLGVFDDRGAIIIILLLVSVGLWFLACKVDGRQYNITGKKILRGLYGGVINLIGMILFITPLRLFI